MKRIISVSIVIFLLFCNLTACEKNENNSITTSDQSKEESFEQVDVLEQNLRLDTVTKESPSTDTQAVYSYEYYEDYIECNLASNVYNIIYYDNDLNTAYVGYYGDSIDDIKKGDWCFSVTYDENNKIVSFGSQGGINLCMHHVVDYKNENQIVINNEIIQKTPDGDQHQELGADILEYKDDKILLFAEDNNETSNEYVLSNNKIVNYANVISGEAYEHTLEYDKSGNLSKATKKSSKSELISSFTYASNDNIKIWHSLTTVSNLPTETDMMVYLLTIQEYK